MEIFTSIAGVALIIISFLLIAIFLRPLFEMWFDEE
jgi:hypothetical protein